EAALCAPSGLAFDADGSLYIADTANRRIRRMDATGTIATVAGSGSEGSGGDGGPASAAELSRPLDLAFGSDGSLYIADVTAHRVRRVTAAGMITTVAGTGEPAFSGDGGPAVEAELDQPAGVACAPDGSLYIAERVSDRIRRVDPDGTITTVA